MLRAAGTSGRRRDSQDAYRIIEVSLYGGFDDDYDEDIR